MKLALFLFLSITATLVQVKPAYSNKFSEISAAFETSSYSSIAQVSDHSQTSEHSEQSISINSDDSELINSLISAIIGGVIVAVVSAFLAHRKMQSEIEIRELLRAYGLLQEAIAFIADDIDDVLTAFEKMDKKSKLEMIDKTSEAVLILDLLGSREVLATIRSSEKGIAGQEVAGLDITSLQTVLRQHIRKKLGLPTFGIPRQLTIFPAKALEMIDKSEKLEETNASL